MNLSKYVDQMMFTLQGYRLYIFLINITSTMFLVSLFNKCALYFVFEATNISQLRLHVELQFLLFLGIPARI